MKIFIGVIVLKKSGVYAIRCLPTNQLYIGGTRLTFEQRFQMHRSQLNTNRATSPLLQEAWNKYGQDAFEFIPLKAFPKNEIAEREREAIMKVKPALNFPVGLDVDGREKTRLRHRQSIGLTGVALYAPPHANTEKFEVDGEWLTRSELAERAGVSYPSIILRLKKGLTGRALIKPPRHK
jgi:hypothetical protein